MTEKKVGEIVDAIPARKRESKYNNNWDRFAELARSTGKPVLAGVNIRNTTVKSLRQYTRPPFVTNEGRIIISLRNSEIGEDGERYGDIYMSWESTTSSTKEGK